MSDGKMVLDQKAWRRLKTILLGEIKEDSWEAPQHNYIQHNNIQHNDIQHNGTQHRGLVRDIQHNNTVITLNVIMVNVTFYCYAE